MSKEKEDLFEVEEGRYYAKLEMYQECINHLNNIMDSLTPDERHEAKKMLRRWNKMCFNDTLQNHKGTQ